MQQHDAEEQMRQAWPLEVPSATQHMTTEGSPARHDKQQLLQDSIMLLEHRTQLQGQVRTVTRAVVVLHAAWVVVTHRPYTFHVSAKPSTAQQQHCCRSAMCLSKVHGTPARHTLPTDHRADVTTPCEPQVEELQQQLAVMQQHHHNQRQQHSMPDPSYEAVIAGLRSSMAQVSSMASTVSQENKLLTAENKRLQELREQQSHALQQKQVRLQRVA